MAINIDSIRVENKESDNETVNLHNFFFAFSKTPELKGIIKRKKN